MDKFIPNTTTSLQPAVVVATNVTGVAKEKVNTKNGSVFITMIYTTNIAHGTVGIKVETTGN